MGQASRAGAGLEAERRATGRPGLPAVLRLQALGRLILLPVRRVAGHAGEAEPAPGRTGELVSAVEAVTGVFLVIVARLAISQFEPDSPKGRGSPEAPDWTSAAVVGGAVVGGTVVGGAVVGGYGRGAAP